MNRLSLFITIILFTTIAHGQKVYDYPIAPKDSSVNTYFESTIADPYQWMENPTDPRLLTWLEAQKKITRKQGRQQINKSTLQAQVASMFVDVREEKIEGYVDKVEKEEDKYEFKFEYDSYKRVPDLLYRKTDDGNFQYLVRIKDFRKTKSDNLIITDKTMNPKQDLIAVEMSHNGSDWREIRFFNLESGKVLPDTLQYLRGNSQVIWDDEGVYYDRYNKPRAGMEHLDMARGQALYYHKIGTPQAEDLILYQNPDTTGTNDFSYFKQDSTKLFFYHFYKSRGKNYKALSYATINKDKSFFLNNFLVYPNSDSISFQIEELFGDTVILKTTWDAPNGKLMKANINQRNKMEALVPEYDTPVRSVNRLGKDKIACIYADSGKYLVLIYNLDGKLLKSLDFPVGKKVDYFYEYSSDVDYTDFCVSSFFHPDIWYQLSLKDFTYKPSNTLWVPYDAKSLETKYVKYTSKDGTQVPMFITCLKNTKLDGSNPTLLYGYGGYGISVEPEFDESRVLWLLHGGILAIPDIRGGGVYNSEWEKGGRRLKKQKTIDDFIAAAEYLIKEKYTNPKKLAISGGSHGGLIVGAAITQRPELFKAAIAEAGVYDMMRAENFTSGSKNLNINEYGTVSNEQDFTNLKSYSPLHNIKKGVSYPNVLLMTGDSDDRVPPLHSYKFLATLQELGNPESLYQLYITPGSGHGGALTPVDWVNKTLFEYYFLFDQLDLEFR